MKKLLVITALLFLALTPLLPGQMAVAVDVINNNQVCSNPDASAKPAICKDNQTGSPTNPIIGPGGALSMAIKLLSIVIGAIAIIVIIISSLRMILSGGDANKIAQARSSLIYALVGLAVAVAAQAIVAFVINRLHF